MKKGGREKIGGELMQGTGEKGLGDLRNCLGRRKKKDGGPRSLLIPEASDGGRAGPGGGSSPKSCSRKRGAREKRAFWK